MNAESEKIAVLTEKIERLHECAESYTNGLGLRAGVTLREMKIMIDELDNIAKK